MIPQFGTAFFELSPGNKLTLFSRTAELNYWLDKSKEAADLANKTLTIKADTKRQIARYKGQLETIDGDIEALRAKNKSFAEAEAQRIKGLRQRAQVIEAELSCKHRCKRVCHKGACKRGCKACPSRSKCQEMPCLRAIIAKQRSKCPADQSIGF